MKCYISIQRFVSIAECPVEAIYEEDDIPEGQEGWIEINAEKSVDLPLIEEPMEPLPGAEERKTELGF
jgi:ferredoxin